MFLFCFSEIQLAEKRRTLKAQRRLASPLHTPQAVSALPRRSGSLLKHISQTPVLPAAVSSPLHTAHTPQQLSPEPLAVDVDTPECLPLLHHKRISQAPPGSQSPLLGYSPDMRPCKLPRVLTPDLDIEVGFDSYPRDMLYRHSSSFISQASCDDIFSDSYEPRA